MAASPTDCFWNCCKDLWITGISIADTVSDFIYFEQLLSEDEVHDGVAFAVLFFAIVGLVSMLTGPSTDCGLATSIFFEDFPQIIITTSVQAYLIGPEFSDWGSVAVSSYVFSLLAMGLKVMKLGASDDERVQRHLGPEKACCQVFCAAIAIIAITLGVSWTAAMFIIMFT